MRKNCKHHGPHSHGKCHRRGRHHVASGKSVKDFPEGSQVRIEDLKCCPRERCRLLSMGLTPGTTAEVSSNGCGSCCLRVRNADIILGDELANNVTACPVQDSCEQKTA